MRELVYYVAVSLDGRIAGPNGEIDAFLAEGDHMPWLIERFPETIPGHVRGPLGLGDAEPRAFDTVVMGRATHQVAVDAGLSSGYPHLRQYVVTSHAADLPQVDELTASADDPVALVRRLKADDSPLDIWLCGGGDLAGRLVDEIDRFRLKFSPVLLGDGVPLVAGGVGPRRLELVERTEFDSGVVYAEYVRR